MANYKSLCKWKEKDISKGMELLVSLTEEPGYLCRKCARVANTKKALCKPVAISAQLSTIRRLHVA